MPNWTQFVQGLTTVLNSAGTALARRSTIQFSTGLVAVDDGSKTVVTATGAGSVGSDAVTNESGVSGATVSDALDTLSAGTGVGLTLAPVLFDEFLGSADVTATGVTLGALGTLGWNVFNGTGSRAGSADASFPSNLSINPRVRGAICLKSGASTDCNVWSGAPETISDEQAIRLNQVRSYEVHFIPVLSASGQVTVGIVGGSSVSGTPTNATEALQIRARPGSSTELQLLNRNASSTTSTDLGYTYSAGTAAAQALQSIIAVKFEQRVDGTSGLGTNVWDIFVNDNTTPVQSAVAGPAVWGSALETPVCFMLHSRLIDTHLIVDTVEIRLVEQTLAQKIS